MSLENVANLPETIVRGDPGHVEHHRIIHAALKELEVLSEANETGLVKLTGDQTIGGTKTFTGSVIVPNPTEPNHAVGKAYLDAQLSGKEGLVSAGTASQYYRGDKTWQTLNKSAVGLSNVDNTSDVNKPISNATQGALDLKENSIAAGTTSQYYRGDKTWQTLNKAAVGLDKVDNTSDATKPVSTAMQNALNGKQDNIPAGTTSQYYRGDKTWQTLNKAAVGLQNVDNTSDASKPISTLTQAALDLKANTSEVVSLAGAQTISGVKTFSEPPKFIGTATVGQVWTAVSTDGTGGWTAPGTPASQVDWSNVLNKPTTFAPRIGPNASDAAAGDHTHTKAQVGLGDVDNTSDLAKPLSNAAVTALASKVPASREINTTAPLSGGGPLSSNRTISITPGGVLPSHLSQSAKSEMISYVQTMKTREVGLGELIDGIPILYPMRIKSVRYLAGTANGSGNTIVELRKNGVTLAGSSGTASSSPTAVNGDWSFEAGDILTVYVTAAGTTPGKRLTASILAVKS